MELSLCDIATDPDARTSGVEHSAKSVVQWLSRIERDWLVMFDNANTDHTGVAEYMPQGNRGNVLFTSRDRGLSRYVTGDTFLEVEDMEEEDAVRLLLKSSKKEEESAHLREAARSIVKKLCYLPLAIDQAGAAIASGLCGMGDYLGMYSVHRQALLADKTFQGASNYGRAVYGTWDLSFTAIKRMGTVEAESAIFILQTFAFMHHENITEEIMKRAADSLQSASSLYPPQSGQSWMLHLLQLMLKPFHSCFPSNHSNCGNDHDARSKLYLTSQLFQLDPEGNWDPLCFRKGICMLLSYSLIKKAVNSGVYSLHPLVHCWSRDSMSGEDRQTGISMTSTLLTSSITFDFSTNGYAFHRSLIPHIKALDQYSKELGIEMSYNDQQYTHFALAYDSGGYWKEAEKLEVQVMQTRKRVLGEEHPDTLISIGNLASTYRQQGHWKEAEELEVQVMQTRKRVLGEEHPHTLSSIGNLAFTYRQQGHWKEAEELFVQVMQTRKRVLGEEHCSKNTS